VVSANLKRRTRIASFPFARFCLVTQALIACAESRRKIIREVTKGVSLSTISEAKFSAVFDVCHGEERWFSETQKLVSH
jgi:hypothetical protein